MTNSPALHATLSRARRLASSIYAFRSFIMEPRRTPDKRFQMFPAAANHDRDLTIIGDHLGMD
jgi:hypothetical protein